MSSSPIRVGIVGYGYAGEVIHAPLVQSVADMNVVAVSTSRSRAADTAKSNGYRVYETATELFGADDIDLVVIATPHDTHRTLTEAACASGKHVVCDKLMALDVDEAEAMIRAAREADVLLSVFHNRRWDGDYLVVRSALGLATDASTKRMPNVGTPVQIHSWVYSSGAPNPDRWRAERCHGGGMFSDWGAHLMDQALQLNPGPVRSVFCDMLYVNKSIDVETAAHCVVQFENGGRHIVETRNTFHESGKGFEVWGTDGRLSLRGYDPRENMLNVEVRGAERRAPEYSACFHRAGEEVSVPVPEAGDWAAYYRNIADALLRGAQLAVTPRSVLRVMKLREAAYISAETGRVVEWEI